MFAFPQKETRTRDSKIFHRNSFNQKANIWNWNAKVPILYSRLLKSIMEYFPLGNCRGTSENFLLISLRPSDLVALVSIGVVLAQEEEGKGRFSEIYLMFAQTDWQMCVKRGRIRFVNLGRDGVICLHFTFFLGHVLISSWEHSFPVMLTTIQGNIFF